MLGGLLADGLVGDFKLTIQYSRWDHKVLGGDLPIYPTQITGNSRGKRLDFSWVFIIVSLEGYQQAYLVVYLLIISLER